MFFRSLILTSSIPNGILPRMDNRTLILEKALVLFADRGYDAVGVQEVCDAAGITKPTLYHYFGSKLGLLESLLKGSFKILEERLVESTDYKGDLPFTLQRVAETYFDFAREYPVFYRFQIGLWFSPRESEGYQVVADLNLFQYEMIEAVFSAASVQHGNMRGRHQAYALTFLGMLNNYIGLALNGYTELNRELAFRAVHQFQHGIYS